MKQWIISIMLVGLLAGVSSLHAAEDFGQHCLNLNEHSDILRLWVVASAGPSTMWSLTMQWRSDDPMLPEPYQLIGLGPLTGSLPGAAHAFEIRGLLTNHSDAFAGGEDCRLRIDLDATFSGPWHMRCRGELTLFEIGGTMSYAACEPSPLDAAMRPGRGLPSAGFDPKGYR